MSRRVKRQRFIHWLRSALTTPSRSQIDRSIKLERLEKRDLFASDLAPLLGSQPSATIPPLVAQNTSNLTAEGEAAPDLVAFAKALKDSGTQFFGAYWCPHCTAQKELFQDGAQFLPFVEVTDANRNPNSIATSENITQYPTWEFPDGSRLVGEQTLETLSTRSGVAIPQASKPSFKAIPNTNVEVGAPMHMPVDAYDPNGNPLTVTVTSSNPNVVGAEVLTGNRSMRIRVKDFGDMVFQLFEGDVPIPTSRIIQLANSGFYNGVPFHRVINNFMIQTGGTSGSSLGTIDDQFSMNLQHNRSGVLSYAKTSADDSGDNQFYITEIATRWLDFNHPVFGQLIEGDAVREAISNVATSSGDAPLTPIVIESVTIFNDTENGLIRLKALAGTGTSNITVTVADSEGNSTSQTFTATVVPDAANGAPFLNSIPVATTTVNTPVTINLGSQDNENDTRVYSVQKVGSENYQVTVNSSTGVVNFVPPTGFTGTLQFKASVSQTTTPTTQDPVDSQLVTVKVTAAAPAGVSLDPASDSGSSNSDKVTKTDNPTFIVSGTVAGATVKLKVGTTVIGQATATGASTSIIANNFSALGQGAILVVATQTVDGLETAASPGVTVTFDSVAPVAIASGLIPSSATVGTLMSVNLTHAEEGQGLVYSLTSAPDGMAIDSATGLLTWTPTQSQVGAQSLTLKLTDRAGNETTQNFSITVADKPDVKITLEAVSLTGSPITQISIGQQFKVRFVTQDARGFAATGVFSSYIDLLFNPDVVEPIATNAISHTAPYTNGVSPNTSTPTVAGQINELGGFSSSFSRGDGTPQLIAEVTFVAKAAGDAAIRSDRADVIGNDVLLFDVSEPIAESKISFGAAPLTVGANFQVVDDTFNFDEDSGAHNLDVLANDIATGTAVLTISAVGTPSQGGTVSIAPDGKSVVYTSATNFNGSETFTYTVRNQENVTLTGLVTVQVVDRNDPPVAVNDVAEVTQNSVSNIINVLSNDTTGVDAPASETLRVTAVGTPSAGGTVQVGTNGLNIVYTPKAGYIGNETLTYTLSDGRGGTATGTVSITVKVANPPPVAVTDTFNLVEDAAEASYDVLANDTTDAGETLTVSAVGVSTKGSTLKVATDGKSVLYKPAANLTGLEVLTYTVRDSGGATAVGTVSFNIASVNDAPNAVDDVVTILSPVGTQTVNVLANDTSVDTGEVLTITEVTQPATGQGSVVIATDGKSISYTPPSNTYTGTVTFTYTISDGTLTDSANVTLNVQNFTPRALGGNLTASMNSQPVPLGGVDWVLSGTDFAGASVNYEVTTDDSGNFSKSGLAPGNYNFTRTALPFLEDNGETLPVVSAVSDANNTSLKSVVGGLRSQYINIRDFLGSVSTNSMSLAVVPGSHESWLAIRGGYTGFSNVRAQLDAAVTTLTITAINSANANVSATLPLAGANSRVTIMGQESGARLMQVRGAASDLGFQPVAAPANIPAGEGEAAGTVQASLPVPVVSSNALSGEGEAAPQVNASTAVFTTLNPTQTLRMLLGSAQNAAPTTSGSLVRATTHLPTGAVDQALSEIDTLSLAASEVDSLTAGQSDSTGAVDAALLAL